MEDAPLAERVIDKLAGLRASLARLSDAEARAEYKRLRHAENLYLKATRAAGNMSLYNKLLASINEDENEDKKNSNEHISENMSVSDGEVRYSFKNSNNGLANWIVLIIKKRRVLKPC